jgi:drug/metabolite transporter (DMT)-like permease
MSRDHSTLPRATWWLLAALTLGWGMNWPMMKIALAEIPVWTFRCLSVVGGGVAMFAVARLSGDRLRIPREELRMLAMTALFNVTLWNVFVGYGVRALPAGRAVILAFTMPVWTVLISAFVLRERLTPRKITGVALGMAGLALLLGDSLKVLGDAPFGSAMVLLAAVSWACGTVLMKRHPSTLSTSAFTAWSLVIGGLPLAIGTALLDGITLPPLSNAALGALLYNIFIAFLLCYWLWFRIVTLAPAGVSALGTLMIPVVGITSGMLILGERPGFADLGAMVLVIAALATVLVPARAAPAQAGTTPNR